jgi:hypothetical protein
LIGVNKKLNIIQEQKIREVIMFILKALSAMSLSLILVSPCFADLIIEERFTNPTFPPTGWTAQTSGSNAVWSRIPNYGNPYANASAINSLTFPTTTFGTLKTNNFSMTSGQTLHIEFRSRDRFEGPEPESKLWQLQLYKGNITEFIWDLGETPSYWWNWILSRPISTTSSEYNVRWFFSILFSLDGGSSANFDVDDVVIESCSVAVEPTSLGNIKAVFH